MAGALGSVRAEEAGKKGHMMPCRPTILFAEDDPADVMLLQRTFAKADLPMVLDFVENGEDLEAYLRNAEQPPAVLVLDLQMPRKNGFEILEWFAGEPQWRPPSVIVLSGSGRTEDITRCAQHQVDHYMVKPSDLKELAHMVQTIVDQFESVMARGVKTAG